MSDKITLVVSGQEFTGWTSVGIDMAIDQMADGFSLSAPYDASDLKLRRAFREFEYQPFSLFMGDEELMRGKVDVVDKEFDTSQRSITVAGRSLPGVLCDVSIEGELEFSGLSLATIAKIQAKKHGVSVRVDADSSPLELAKADFGQKIGDFLNSLAAPRNLLLNSSFTGQLVISSGVELTKRPAMGSLIEGHAPLLACKSTADGQKRFSTFTVATQFAGDVDVSDTSLDNSIKIHRPKLIAATETDQHPMKTADRARLEALLAAYNVTTTISGWRRTDGRRWAERQMVTLQSDTCGIYDESRFLIASVKHVLDKGQKRTFMRHILPETFSGEMPKRFPWAS